MPNWNWSAFSNFIKTICFVPQHWQVKGLDLLLCKNNQGGSQKN